jgi:hypothetical protein
VNTRKVAVIAGLALAGLVVLLIVAAVGVNVYLTRFSPAAPFLQGARNASASQRMETMLRNQSEYVPPESGEVSADQIARFVKVEERVESFAGARFAVFKAAGDNIQRAASERGLTVQIGAKEVGSIGTLFLQAKQAQIDAMNAAGFSKDEFDWVRRKAYASANLDFAQLDLAQLLRFESLQERITVKRHSRGAPPTAETRRLVEPLLPSLERWRTLALLGL